MGAEKGAEKGAEQPMSHNGRYDNLAILAKGALNFLSSRNMGRMQGFDVSLSPIPGAVLKEV